MTRTRPELVGLYRTPVPQSGRYDRLRLDKNENIEGPPPAVVRAMLRGIDGHFLSAYPEPGALYAKIAKRHRLSPDNVLITAGSEMAIRYLFEAYLDRGDEVVFLDPSFAMFDVYAALCGARRVKIPCDARLTFDAGKIERAIGPRTKIVAIANPNNPTGTAMTRGALQRLLTRAEKMDALLLVDEAYFGFHPVTLADRVRRHRNLVVARTFSKAMGLASVRLGYLLGHPTVVNEVRKLQPIDHANAFALKLGEYVLDHPRGTEKYLAEVRRGKEYLRRACARLKRPCADSHANFVLIDMGEAKDRLAAECARRKILIGTTVRLPFPNGYVKVTVGPVRWMKHFVAALERVS